jgi:hypothetical protein
MRMEEEDEGKAMV